MFDPLVEFLLVHGQYERVGMEWSIEFVDEDGEPSDLIVQRVSNLALSKERTWTRNSLNNTNNRWIISLTTATLIVHDDKFGNR